MKLKEIRIAHNITQKKLAKDLSYNQTLVSMWEHNRREPSNKALIDLADYFNITVDQLLDHNVEKLATPKLTESQQKIMDILPGLNEQQCSAVLSMIEAFNPVATAKEDAELAGQIKKFEDK